MANIDPKTAKILTIAGAVDCLIAVGILIYIVLGYSNLPVVVPILLLITGIMLIVVSLSFHTKR